VSTSFHKIEIQEKISFNIKLIKHGCTSFAFVLNITIIFDTWSYTFKLD